MMDTTYKEAFTRNIGAVDEAEQEVLKKSRVFIAGAGGLGGYIVELIARLGVGGITVCDKGTFEPTNLNRQLLCTTDTLNKPKSEAAKARAELINPDINFTAIHEELTAENARDLIKGSDIVIDAVDNIQTRLVLEAAAEELNIPLIMGAVNRWSGQVSAVFPGDRTVSKLMKSCAGEKLPPVLCFAVCTTAALEVAEACKVLLDKPTLRKKVLAFDLEEGYFEILEV